MPGFSNCMIFIYCFLFSVVLETVHLVIKTVDELQDVETISVHLSATEVKFNNSCNFMLIFNQCLIVNSKLSHLLSYLSFLMILRKSRTLTNIPISETRHVKSSVTIQGNVSTAMQLRFEPKSSKYKSFVLSLIPCCCFLAFPTFFFFKSVKVFIGF